jgi:membrane protease subunit (stomatin/prohibitin family)
MGAIWDRITTQFIEIIEWLDDSHDTLVWRFPVRAQEIKNGAKLIVREGQTAVFVNEGKLADVFGPGTYTLTTQNLPILATLKGWKYGFNSPFKAEVYFVSTTQFTDLKWGTQNPIMLRDPEFGPIRLRAFGIFAVRIADAAKFLRQVAGTDSNFDLDEILGQLKRTLVARFTSALGAAKVPALDLAGHYDEVGKKVLPSIKADFEDMGIEVTKFLVENISLPPAVEQMLDKRSEMAIMGNMQNYAAFQMANAIPDAARTPNSMAGLGMGAAAGWGMGQQMANAMGNVFQPQQPQQQPAPQAAPTAGGNMVERLKKLDALKAAGVLTDQEYAAKRAEILSEI